MMDDGAPKVPMGHRFFKSFEGVTATCRTAFDWILDAVLPPCCPQCGVAVGGKGGLCASCFSTLTFITNPVCTKCGLPLPGGDGVDDLDRLCPECQEWPLPFGRARAALVYDAASAPLVLRFKHGDRTDTADLLGRWMAYAGRSILTPGRVLVPVPLHWTRLFTRRYNQAGLLAQAVGRQTGLPVVSRAFLRVQRTASQGHGRRSARFANVRDAFRVSDVGEIKGRDIVLIDDVLTTGATMTACTLVLEAAGARSVDVLTLARVPPPGAKTWTGNAAHLKGQQS